MDSNRIKLSEAKKFHGHLGPYLVLGLLAGELALKKLKCKKYFGLKVKVFGADKKPKSCLIDGLQLSSGTTYGKGNIKKFGGKIIKVSFQNSTGKKFVLRLKDGLRQILEAAKTHKDSELLAKELYKSTEKMLFCTNYYK
ncbi:MAG: FmdE family protein [Candidatus Omnitrophota bacterium]|nr:FmdE family protein [Candidatus Omnitrophota bacterium]